MRALSDLGEDFDAPSRPRLRSTIRSCPVRRLTTNAGIGLNHQPATVTRDEHHEETESDVGRQQRSDATRRREWASASHHAQVISHTDRPRQNRRRAVSCSRPQRRWIVLGRSFVFCAFTRVGTSPARGLVASRHQFRRLKVRRRTTLVHDSLRFIEKHTWWRSCLGRTERTCEPVRPTANRRSPNRSSMPTRDEPQYSKESVLLVDDAAATPLLYREDTPALTAESILERSRQRCPPGRSPLLDNVRRAARASAGRLSASARAIHDRAIDLGWQLKAAARPALRLPAAYRGFQAVLQRPRPRPGRLAAGAATLGLLMVLAIAMTMAPEPRRTSVETQAAGSVGAPSLPTVAPASRLADRTVPRPSIPTKVGTVGGPVAGTQWKAPSTDKSGSSRRAVSTGLVGTLLVNSEPSGAEVLINGIPHGRTPLSVSALPVGSRVIRLELAGYDRWSWAVNITADKRTPLQVKLQPERHHRIPGS